MSAAPGTAYSRLDRMLHRLAFAGIEVQKSLADIEDRMHAAALSGMEARSPVFVTGLPRAGTTVLLDIVAANPGFVSHTYRAMPFVLCPLLWESVSRGFRKASVSSERAHADGVPVGFDSPEAFEEILWKAFWPGKYRADHIQTWTISDRNAEFEIFFRNHIRKLILASGASNAPALRYASKNNANIARLTLLRAIFPDAAIVVPFREPAAQAISLLRQHRRFTAMQGEDAFVRRYMDDIGHFEFGRGLKPLAFPARAGLPAADDALTADFWLCSWIRAYQAVLDQGADAILVDFDRLSVDAARGLSVLATAIGARADAFEGQAALLRPAPRYDEDLFGLDNELLARARRLHGALMLRAVNAETAPTRAVPVS